jgi:hypothetical protein
MNIVNIFDEKGKPLQEIIEYYLIQYCIQSIENKKI